MSEKIVVILDDERQLGDLVKEYLEENGYTAFNCQSCDKFREYVKNNKWYHRLLSNFFK